MAYMDELDKPNLDESELFSFLHDEEGLTGITRRSVRYAVLRREIQPTQIGNRNRFTKRDGLQWVESLKAKPKRPPKAQRLQPQSA